MSEYELHSFSKAQVSLSFAKQCSCTLGAILLIAREAEGYTGSVHCLPHSFY